MQQKFFTSITIWFSVTLFYCYQYILRILPNIMMPELVNKFNINLQEFGVFASLYYLGYVTLHIPIGIILSKSGAKKILPLCILLATLGLVPIIYCNSWNYVLIGRLIIGIGSSAAIIGALQMFRIIYPNHFSQMLGITACLGILTVFNTSKPLTYILKNFGLKSLIDILIFSGITLAIILYFILPKFNKESDNVSIISSIKSIMKNYQLILISIFAGLMIGPLEGFSDAWGGSFINHVYNIDRETANSIVSYIFIGLGIGFVVVPFIADKTKALYPIIIISGIIMAGCFLYMPYNNNISNLSGLCFLIGLASSYQILAVTKGVSCTSLEFAGIAGAVVNMIMMAFGAFFHNAMGFIMNNGEKKIIGDITTYSDATYFSAISVIPYAAIIGVTGFIILYILECATGHKNQFSN